MARIKGIKIILLDKIVVGKDPFGADITEEKEIEVENVLVSPVTTNDVVNRLDLEGKKAVYKLAIPKGDNNIWENRKVVFFGKKWRTIGLPLEGIDDLIPLSWNKQVLVEVYE